MEKNITIVQIAKESGVSIATVSRVINGNVPVSPATRMRVENVIRKYNFSPNALARGLICQQTKTIGVLIPDITNPYFSSFFRCVQRQSAEAGYSVFLCNTGFCSADKAKGIEEGFFRTMLERKNDGVIVAGGQLDLMQPGEEYLASLQNMAERTPVVAVGRAVEGVKCRFVQPDAAAGISSAVLRLAELGHRRIAFLGGEVGVTVTQARLQAYRDAVTAAGLEADDELTALTDYYTADGYAAAQTLINRRVKFTAALAVNDNVALGAMRAFADNRFRVPEDVALISCDQFFNADYFSPRLSSIDRHNERLAQYVVSALLSLMRHEECEPMPEIEAELILRESSGTAKRLD